MWPESVGTEVPPTTAAIGPLEAFGRRSAFVGGTSVPALSASAQRFPHCHDAAKTYVTPR
ncbi:hypothetical protein [Lysobacter enzymogenes]|uniref:hypothetical protein n=1 Tax=Lysobacter enzymogenes TaxID=69 RepID=UPI003D18C4AD